VVEVLCLLRDGRVARLGDLPESMRHSVEVPPPGDEGMARRGTIEVPLDQTLDRTVEQIVSAALDLEGGNRSRAARRLGVSLRTMQRYAARGIGLSH
jgi:DNA-binding NtrC family response regulator